jgi:DNA helicase HerA-like ATPase
MSQIAKPPPQQQTAASPAPPRPPVVGTLVGESTSTEFRLAVKHEAIREQDLIAVDAELRKPDSQDTESIRVWAKVKRIERLNPLFPKESGHELADAGIGAFDTVLSLSKEMVTAVCQVLGWEPRGTHEGGKLNQLRYPAKPATEAYPPGKDDITRVVIGDLQKSDKKNRALDIAHLANRSDVDVAVDGHAVVTRHLAILAMTGSGKTWAARRIIEQLAAKHYPIVIFDPHGDYTGLADVSALESKVRRYHAQFPILEQEPDEVLAVVETLSGKLLSDTMRDKFKAFFHAVAHVTKSDQIRKDTEDWLANYLGKEEIRRYGIRPDLWLFADLAEAASKAAREEDREAQDKLKELTGREELRLSKQHGSWIEGSVGRIRRAACTLKRMEDINRQIASKSGTTASEALPSERTDLVRYDGITVISLAGYTSDFQATIYRLVAESLLEARVAGRMKLPVLLVLEEGHTFAPSSPATAAEKAAVEVTRQIAQEGRKFGVGMILISQRPGRLDETALSMCNSFIVMRMVNPNDQRFVRNVIETLGEDDARLLPDLDTGEAIFSGQFISFPVLAKVKPPESRGEREEEDAFKKLEDARQAATRDASNRQRRS